MDMVSSVVIVADGGVEVEEVIKEINGKRKKYNKNKFKKRKIQLQIVKLNSFL